MAGESRWIFTRAQLIDTPSRKCGIDSDKELNYRQQTANFIQDMGQRLQVTQLCINTAIVYMHRFYMFHSFTKFNRNNMAAACLFLAAKVEEQPRKLEHVIKVAHMCLHRESLDPKSETYLEQAQELVVNENILLQTLGFDIQVDHPHTHVVKTCSLVRASKDLAQTSYFLATNSLHLTTMCLQHKPTVVACVCIHLACKWSNWEIPQSNEGREWFWYTDKDVTLELLEALTQDFLTILDRCPSKLKKKILTWKSGRDGAEGAEPTPLNTSSSSSSSRSKPSSSAGGPSASASSSSAGAPSASAQSLSRSQARREGQGSQQAGPTPAPAPSGGDGQPAAAASSRGPGEAAAGTMRRVKTEPVLTHQSLTPKEYLQRRERKERELREKSQQQQALQQQQSAKLAQGHPQQAPSANSSQETKERHHMDIFLPGSEQGSGRPGADGPDGGGRGTRERPPGEQPHRSSQPAAGGADARGDRRSHDERRHHQGAQQHPSSRGPAGNHHHHGERHHRPGPDRGSGSHDRANNGHSERPEVDGLQVKSEPREGGQSRSEARDGGQVKTEPREMNQTKTEPRDKHGVPGSHRDGPPPVASSAHPGEHPPHSSSSHQKDLKIKINRKAHSVSPSTEMNNEKSLKMKIKLPVSPNMSKRGEDRSHRASPLATAGDGLKLKLDLKHRMHSSASASSNPSDDRHSHSNRPAPATQSSGEGGDHRAEYQLTNQGSNSLKLVISKGKLSGGPTDSPGGGSEKSSKRHHSHHSRSGSEKHHHSRKRGPPAGSPQDGAGRTVSTSRGHSASHGHPSKMHRTDSSGHLHGRSSSGGLPDGMLPPTNGTHQPGGVGPGGVGAPDQQAQLEQIKQTQLQLQQLINLHQHKLMQSQVQGHPHNTNYGQPPLPPQPPDESGIPPPPPPPPTEPPPLPPYSFN